MVATSESETAASQAASDTSVNADIDTSEAFKAGVYSQSQSWAHNLKRLADSYQQLDLKLAQDYADMGVERARKAQTMWEDNHSELMKDLAEIRGRRMNQFDFAVDKIWNINETDQLAAKTAVQQDVTASALIAKLIDDLNAIKAKVGA